MASEILLNISRDEVERARLMSEYKYELDTQSKLVHAEREGIKKGRKEGREEGRKEGREEEKQEMKYEIMEQLKNGKSPEEIVKSLVGNSEQ